MIEVSNRVYGFFALYNITYVMNKNCFREFHFEEKSNCVKTEFESIGTASDFAKNRLFHFTSAEMKSHRARANSFVVKTKAKIVLRSLNIITAHFNLLYTDLCNCGCPKNNITKVGKRVKISPNLRLMNTKHFLN